MPVFKDLSGERFGRLVVTSYSHKKKGSNWNCLCDCGVHASTLYSRLDRGVSIEQAVFNGRMSKINGRG